MEERLEQSLELIIFILQERQQPTEYSRLAKTLLRRNADQFYDIDFKLKKLTELGYIKEDSAIIELTNKGFEFKGFGEIKYQNYLDEKEKDLNLSNLELQNKSLRRQEKIDRLTIENIELQNKQLRRYVIFSIIGFIAGALLTNLKDIIELFEK